MDYRLEPFKAKHLENATNLFINNYREAKKDNSLLSSRILDEPEWIRIGFKTY